MSSKSKHFVLPFLYDQAWRSNDNLIKFKDGLMFLNVLPNKGQQLHIEIMKE